MRRNNLFRTIIAVVIFAAAIYQLFPTYELWQLRKKADTMIADLRQLYPASPDEIKAALNEGLLENRVRSAISNQDSLAQAVNLVKELDELNKKMNRAQESAIKQGLDLQGGTYLVYEADLPKLMETVANSRDAKLDSIIAEAQQTSIRTGEDFFEVFRRVFEREGIRMNRYFGRRTQNNGEIIAELDKQAEDTIDRTLEIIRNRVDRFGVSEPTITKQGSRRIIIELAGVQDISRAKKIIGDTALLEFKLVKEPSTVYTLLQDIDRAWLEHLKKQSNHVDTAAAPAATVAQQDTTPEDADLRDILGENILSGDSAEAANGDIVVDDAFLQQEKPFLALLGRDEIGGSIEKLIPAKNIPAINRILQHPSVRRVIPDDVQFHYYGKPIEINGQEYYQFEVTKREPELTGRYIEKAEVTISSGTQSLTQGEPQVSLTFDGEGARIFSRVTGANVNKRLAIILDDKVASAPNINERIPSGNASITGSFTMEEANELAIVLRAGALPAPVNPIEERTVGPSLGQDSVRRGQLSILLGIALVIVFMVVYYRLSGLVANFALIMNLILVLAMLATMDATLTLPGVAGIILTIGMAVDANVLIFERIREELRTGKTARAAVDAGYSRAFWTIFDANVTTFLTALVLYQFGSGPIRGFALTLMIGIAATMFTAIVVTRLIFDYYTQKRKVAKLSI